MLDDKLDNSSLVNQEIYDPYKFTDLVPYFGLVWHGERFSGAVKVISKMNFEKQEKELKKILIHEVPVGLALIVYHTFTVVSGVGIILGGIQYLRDHVF